MLVVPAGQHVLMVGGLWVYYAGDRIDQHWPDAGTVRSMVGEGPSLARRASVRSKV